MHDVSKGRRFELVSPDELKRVKNSIHQRDRHLELEEAVTYLSAEPEAQSVRVRVVDRSKLRRMRESAHGYARRKGFEVKTFHKDGWLYLEKRRGK